MSYITIAAEREMTLLDQASVAERPIALPPARFRALSYAYHSILRRASFRRRDQTCQWGSHSGNACGYGT